MQMQSEQINDLVLALAQAQAEMSLAKKDASNPYFKSNYADFESIVMSSRPALTKNGLAVIQTTSIDQDGKITLITMLAHKSGQFIKGSYPINPIKNDPQAIGSATTYAKRYAYAAIVGVVTSDDDDGEAAMGRPVNHFKESPKATKIDPKLGPGDYVMKGGKFKGLALKDINPHELYDYIKAIKDDAVSKGQDLSKPVKELVDACESYLAGVKL